MPCLPFLHDDVKGLNCYVKGGGGILNIHVDIVQLRVTGKGMGGGEIDWIIRGLEGVIVVDNKERECIKLSFDTMEWNIYFDLIKYKVTI